MIKARVYDMCWWICSNLFKCKEIIKQYIRYFPMFSFREIKSIKQGIREDRAKFNTFIVAWDRLNKA